MCFKFYINLQLDRYEKVTTVRALYVDLLLPVNSSFFVARSLSEKHSAQFVPCLSYEGIDIGGRSSDALADISMRNVQLPWFFSCLRVGRYACMCVCVHVCVRAYVLMFLVDRCAQAKPARRLPVYM